ncbi:Putative ribonuclease H protein At1g65750 [Linum perenne]
MGFPLTQNLGRYLGVPVLHERTTASTFQGIVDRIDLKLTGWKAKSLSLAGRVTLAQAALSAIPAYAMQTTVLPATTCEAIDKRIRNFIWGSTDEERKTHLVSWERICAPKENGGLGLKLSRILNRAYMTKLAFNFFRDTDRLWVRILQSKYFKHSNQEAIEMIMGMSPPNPDRGEDVWVWGASSDGKFSIKSAYNLIHNQPESLAPDFWSSVWCWRGPNRIKFFLWLVIHGRLLTNVARQKRKMTDNASCPLSAWLKHHLCSDRSISFGVVCWYLWKARNERVFTPVHQPAQNVAFRAMSWSKTIIEAMSRDISCLGSQGTKEVVNIAWDPGPIGWVTVNTDGSVNPQTRKAAAGGLLRDVDGRCLHAFTMNLGVCSITRAELRGAIRGLEIAWDNGFRHVELQIDFMAVVALLNSQAATDHQHGMEIIQFRELRDRDWVLRVKHTYREGNHAADHLASRGYGYPFGSHTISTSCSSLGYFIRLDCIGISEPRLVSIND